MLIIGAWNYPVQLSLLPAINALSAGNGVVESPFHPDPPFHCPPYGGKPAWIRRLLV